jgi:hypothetical protein
MKSLLVIVPCGQKKLWDRDSNAGPTAAKNVYTGSPFRVNREYAEHFAEKWVVLSAKYGFVEPDFQIPGPYNITFKRKSSGPITTAMLREQIRKLMLDRFSKVVGLGGKDYRQAINDAFEGMSVKPEFPFAGLQIGKMMQATKRAVATNNPLGRAAAARNGKKSKRKNA